MQRVFNSSAGPSVLPETVLERAAKEMKNFRGSGMSVLELSHRGSHFSAILSEAEERLRELLHIPPDYRILFLQGGASTQFAMVPLNLMGRGGMAEYLHTGCWSAKAIAEAQRYGRVRIVASSEPQGFKCIPDLDDCAFGADAAYVHMTSNNTIEGTRFSALPRVGSLPLVADMSSSFLAEEIEVERFGLIYAGAQKNAGPAGLTIVLVREELIGQALPITPTMLDYATHAHAGSRYNTPPAYGIYIAGLVFQWIADQGGVAAMARRNREKASLLYDFLDHSRLYSNPVAPASRSLMNIPFLLADKQLEATFLAEADAAGLVNLKGHRSVGGMRASLYNAMPLEGVRNLVAFMDRFERVHAPAGAAEGSLARTIG